MSAGSLSAATLGSMPGSLAKSASQVQEPALADLKAAGGELCYVCGSVTMQSGKGLRQCFACGSMQLKGGGTSHAYAMAHADDVLEDGTTSRQASKRSTDQGEIDMGGGAKLNPLGARNAWRRISQDAAAEMAKANGFYDAKVSYDDEDGPIMAGFVDTGYRRGDRVMTRVRLPGAVPGGCGWDPIDTQTDQGVVTGVGHTAGEIMVTFDHSGYSCSMKMSQIEKVKPKVPNSHVDRSRCRKGQMTRISTL
jgi:hypothetical protein